MLGQRLHLDARHGLAQAAARVQHLLGLVPVRGGVDDGPRPRGSKKTMKKVGKKAGKKTGKKTSKKTAKKIIKRIKAER